MAGWDAAAYDRVAEPQTRWGETVLERLAPAAGEVVLDAGCGTGRVTERLARMLHGGRVVALDASPAMASVARRRLAPYAWVAVVVADLARPLPLAPASVDAVVSTATFHWIADHDALFEHLAAALRSGGRLVAQCGAAGNIASVLAAAAAAGVDAPGARTFATAEETAARLDRAGFVDVRTWTEPAPTTFDAEEALEEFLAAVCLREHLVALPPGDRPGFVRDVARRLGDRTVDYVRLNIDARRA